MEITVKFVATLGKAAGLKELTLDVTDVKSLIRSLNHAFRGNEEFLRQLKQSNLIVNDTNVNYLDGKKTLFTQGDVVTLFPPLGGG